MNELTQFISMNNIKKDILEEALHLEIREVILKKICDNFKKDNNFLISSKKSFFARSNIEATKKIVNKVCHCSLPETDLEWMMKCITAFFNKDSKRKTFSIEEKQKILNIQNNKCAICGNTINISTFHMDHIIPWDYVGDRLENNIQGLCSKCNLEKSNHIAIAVSNIILNMEAQK